MRASLLAATVLCAFGVAGCSDADDDVADAEDALKADRHLTLKEVPAARFAMSQRVDNTAAIAAIAARAAATGLSSTRISELELDRKTKRADAEVDGLKVRASFAFDDRAFQVDAHRRPQAISPHYGASGAVELVAEHYWVAVTVADVFIENGAQTNHQLSVLFVDTTTGGYRRVVLAAPVANADVPGGFDLAPIRRHGDGVVWFKNFLICQNGSSVQVFDTEKVFRVRDAKDPRTGFDPATRSFHADSESYVMPMVAELDGPEVPAMASASLDQKGTAGAHVGFYAANKTTGQIIRWPLDDVGAGIFLTDEAGNIAADEGYVLVGWNPEDTLRGIARVEGPGKRSFFYVGAMTRLLRIERKAGAHATRVGVLPRGNEQLAWDPDRDTLWAHTEEVGHKVAFEVVPD